MDTENFERNANQLEQEIRRGLLNKIWEYSDGESTDSSWTKAVKEILKEVADSNKWQIAPYTYDAKLKYKQWLYDFVLFEYDNDSLTDVHLVVECEWGNNYDLQADFEKLILARSPHRLMIFEGKSKNEIEDKITLLMIISYPKMKIDTCCSME